MGMGGLEAVPSQETAALVALIRDQGFDPQASLAGSDFSAQVLRKEQAESALSAFVADKLQTLFPACRPCGVTCSRCLLNCTSNGRRADRFLRRR